MKPATLDDYDGDDLLVLLAHRIIWRIGRLGIPWCLGETRRGLPEKMTGAEIRPEREFS